jgi:hypothetical protein
MWIQIAIVIITAVFIGFTAYLTDKFDKSRWLKILIIVFVSITGGFANLVYKHYDRTWNKPSVEVERIIGPNHMAIAVKPDTKSTVKSIRLSFHLPVRVRAVQHDNRVTDGKAEVIVIGGTDKGYLTNRVDFDIYQVFPGRPMNFLITFDPAKEVSLEYVDKDLYELSYLWTYNSENIYESEWRRIDTNERVSAPPAQIGVIRFVGTADDGGLMFTLKLLQKGIPADIVKIKAVEKGYSYGKKGVDDQVQTALPRRSY